MDFFSRRPQHNYRRTFFEMYKCFPASFFGKEEVEKGNMSKI